MISNKVVHSSEAFFGNFLVCCSFHWLAFQSLQKQTHVFPNSHFTVIVELFQMASTKYIFTFLWCKT